MLTIIDTNDDTFLRSIVVLLFDRLVCGSLVALKNLGDFFWFESISLNLETRIPRVCCLNLDNLFQFPIVVLSFVESEVESPIGDQLTKGLIFYRLEVVVIEVGNDDEGEEVHDGVHDCSVGKHNCQIHDFHAY